MERSVGICLGASTITIAERTGKEIRFSRRSHEGRVAQVFGQVLAEILPAKLGVTGKKFRNLVSIPTLSEPEAVELAYGQIKSAYPDIDCIISAGAETFIIYTLDKQGTIRGVQTGNKCASGTGEFFLQQIKRMELGIEEAVHLAMTSQPYPVAGRCSVFCKSDCTHALNKGLDKGRVVAGLGQMMAGKIIELLKKVKAQKLLVVGGVSQNRVVIKYLREKYPATYLCPEGPYFEALGALLWAEKQGFPVKKKGVALHSSPSSYPFLPSLKEALLKVSFKSWPRGELYDGEYILGLDVGSTTTKAVLIRRDNYAMVASVYLRTKGDPVGASRKCYRAIREQLPEGYHPRIIGLGVTGSGRQIAGLHGQTRGVINEIVAHAAAAVYFDPEVETIFEIGGQDAKYTFITNRVAVDYAMNEACSAGTGSFLEEACLESLGLKTEDIAALALNSDYPSNFSDQCAAFIGSDIKTAVQEGIPKEDIVAGLVYSVCQNYLNRVKGNRPIGKKIFMQGGVCYNPAVPAAMAALCRQEIIVPPEPGLMGAFGVALEVERKIQQNLLEKKEFDLAELANREVAYKEPFTCGGGPEKCDRGCSIARIEINHRIYPFGGACSKYYNLGEKKEAVTRGADLVRVREELVFHKYAPQEEPPTPGKLTVGIPTSLLTNTFYPLYANFFHNLGFRTVRSTHPVPEGQEAKGAAYCFPVELSHGFIRNLLDRKVDYVFLPHVKYLAWEGGKGVNCTCPFVQGEPYYLQATFYDELKPKLITEVLEFNNQAKVRQAFLKIGGQLGVDRRQAARAFADAWEKFQAMTGEMLDYGQRFLAGLQPEETALVLFGRPYNAFSKFGHLGIPHKFTSRGYKIIPHDFLPLPELGVPVTEEMYWATGQVILQAAHFVQRQPNLFGVFITNFSCGPDSFITGYFRNIMGRKPALILELDAHTADAGIDTRIEAFLDVVKGYRELNQGPPSGEEFSPARLVEQGGQFFIRASNGQDYRLTDPGVRVLVPSMGDTATRGIAAAMTYVGVKAVPAPPPGQEELILGKGITTGKECLPLILTAGSLLKYLQEREEEDEILVYFMPKADGPCRLGQYSLFLKNYLVRQSIPNVALLSLTSRNSYAGMPPKFTRRAWLAINISDGLDDIYSALLALAEDREGALKAFTRGRDRIIQALAAERDEVVMAVLREEMLTLASFRQKISLAQATKISLIGEIYVRRDGFSRQYLVEKLAQRGIVVKTAPISEWFYYIDYCVNHNLLVQCSWKEKVLVRMKELFMKKDEQKIKQILRLSGYYDGHLINIDHLMTRGARLIDPRLTGETLLTVSSAITEVGDETHGVISIGPFGCMPCRIAEGIVTYRLEEEKENFSPDRGSFWSRNKKRLPLPFLAIESDGNPFPQVVEARLESFILAAHRLKAQLRTLPGES